MMSRFPHGPQMCRNGNNCRFLRNGTCSFSHTVEEVANCNNINFFIAILLPFMNRTKRHMAAKHRQLSMMPLTGWRPHVPPSWPVGPSASAIPQNSSSPLSPLNEKPVKKEAAPPTPFSFAPLAPLASAPPATAPSTTKPKISPIINQDKKSIAFVKETPIDHIVQAPPAEAAPTANPSSQSDNFRSISTHAAPTNEVPMKAAPTALSETSSINAPTPPTASPTEMPMKPPKLQESYLGPTLERRIKSAKDSYDAYLQKVRTMDANGELNGDIDQADSINEEIDRLKDIWDQESGVQTRCSNCLGGQPEPLPQCSDCSNGQHLCNIVCEDNGCTMGHYCSPECQLEHWPIHWHQHKHFKSPAPFSPSSSASSSLVASPPNTISVPLACTYCKRAAPKDGRLLQCSKCKKIQYCDKTCQSAHWPTHKSSCTAPDLQYNLRSAKKL